MRPEVAILLLIDSLSFPVKTSSFQGRWNLEAVCRNESSDKTISCKLHPRPSAKASIVFTNFYSSKSGGLSIGGNESPSRLTPSIVMDVVGSNISLVFSDTYKSVKALVIWGFVPVGLGLTS